MSESEGSISITDKGLTLSDGTNSISIDFDLGFGSSNNQNSSFDSLFSGEIIDNGRRFVNEILPGWMHQAVTPFHPQDANRVEFQNTPQLPVTYYEWYDTRGWFSGRRQPTGRRGNWILDPTDPTELHMDITYGPMLLYDVDAMTQAVADGVQLDESFYQNGWWFSMSLEGTTVALRTGDYVIQYMAWENPNQPGKHEQWSCVGQYQEWDGTFDADVYNYRYGSPVLVNDEVERNGDSIDYQTTYHTNYEREGPWHLAASRKYYSTIYKLSADVTAMNCSGVRKMVSPLASFNPPMESDISMQVGFRVYTDANDQVARHFKDYPAITFTLKGAYTLMGTVGALAGALLLQAM